MSRVGVKIEKSDHERYREKQDDVFGVGRSPSGALYLETKSSSSDKRHVIRFELDGSTGRAEHNCTAAIKGNACWHLAAAIDIAAIMSGRLITYPFDVMIERGDKKSPLEDRPRPPVQDITPDMYGRPGDFRYLNIHGRYPPPAPDISDIPDIRPDGVWSDISGIPPSIPPVPLPAISDDEAWLTGYGFPGTMLEKVISFRGDQKDRLSDEQMAMVPQAKYVPVEHELISSVAALLYGPSGSTWEPVLLKGPRGTGKSTLADTLGSILMMPVVRITGGVDVNAEWLLGSRTLDYDEDGRQRVVHEPGLLLQAIQDGAMLVVEEINMVLPEVTSLLHSLLDWQRILPVPGVGHVKPPEQFRLVACMNLNYAGTRGLNEAFKDRFREINVPFLPAATLARVIADNGVPKSIADTLADIFHTLVKRVQNDEITDEALSIRSLIRAGKEMDSGVNSKEAIVSNLVDGIDDRLTAKVVKEIIDSRLRP